MLKQMVVYSCSNSMLNLIPNLQNTENISEIRLFNCETTRFVGSRKEL